MNNSIQLISDSDGLAVIGNIDDIERFLVEKGLNQLPSKDLELQKLGKISHIGSIAMQAGSTIGKGSGRWVQITEKSASQISQFGLMKSKDSGLSLGVVKDSGGKIKDIVEFSNGPGQIFANPAILAGAAGIMAQVAIQKQIEEVVEYLQEIDAKVGEIIRGQKDAVLSDVLGADLIIQEAWSIRNQVGHVSDVTWSKVQGTSFTIARSQAYALRQLDAIAEKLHDNENAAEIAETAHEAETKVRVWIEILARCIQLQDTLAILELDRVLDALPEELNQHRLGLNAARRNRQELIARCSFHLLSEIDETVNRANSKVLFNPFKSPATVQSSNQVAAELHNFRMRIGLETGHDQYKTKEWIEAATEAKDKILSTTAKGINDVRQYGIEASEKAAKSLLSGHKNNSDDHQEDKDFKSTNNLDSAIKDLTGDPTSNAISAISGLVSGAASAVGSLYQKKEDDTLSDSDDPTFNKHQNQPQNESNT